MIIFEEDGIPDINIKDTINYSFLIKKINIPQCIRI